MVLRVEFAVEIRRFSIGTPHPCAILANGSVAGIVPLATGPLGQALLIVQKKDVVKLNAVVTPICSLKQ